MSFDYQVEKQEWEQDEIVEWINELLAEITDCIDNIDELVYFGLPDEKSNSFVREDGTLEFNKGDSFVDAEGNLILKYD